MTTQQTQKRQDFKTILQNYLTRADFYHRLIMVEPLNTTARARYDLNERIFFARIDHAKPKEREEQRT